MSKFSAPTIANEQSRLDAKCHRCGWDFNEKHEQEFKKADGTTAKRVNVRDQIWLPSPHGHVIRCGTCYEDELLSSGKHRYSGHEAITANAKRSIEQEREDEQKRLNPTRRAA